MQECRYESEIKCYRRIQVSNNKFFSGILMCSVQDNNTCESEVVVCAVYCKRRELCFFPSCLTIYDPLEESDRKLYDEVSEYKHHPLYSIECFHMTSRRPCGCPKPVPWELNSFRMQTLSFVPINLHRYRPREWKHSIAGVYFSKISVRYFWWGFSCCP